MSYPQGPEIDLPPSFAAMRLSTIVIVLLIALLPQRAGTHPGAVDKAQPDPI